jgi:hypothetical protein
MITTDSTNGFADPTVTDTTEWQIRWMTRDNVHSPEYEWSDGWTLDTEASARAQFASLLPEVDAQNKVTP